jgi:hypothetical protein
MTVENHKRRQSGESNHATLHQIDLSLSRVLERIAELHEASADSGQIMKTQLDDAKKKLLEANKELEQLRTNVSEKRTREHTEMTLLYQDQFEKDMESLVRESITIPEFKMRLYWDHLRFALEPAPTGGVLVTMGFPHTSRLPDLKFVLQFSTTDETFTISDCDPMVIGLTDLVSTLNTDTKPGALARFCCRARSTYTAQYSTDLGCGN